MSSADMDDVDTFLKEFEQEQATAVAQTGTGSNFKNDAIDVFEEDNLPVTANASKTLTADSGDRKDADKTPRALPESTIPVPSKRAKDEDQQSAFQQMVSMGYGEDTVRAALSQADDNVEDAITLIESQQQILNQKGSSVVKSAETAAIEAKGEMSPPIYPERHSTLDDQMLKFATGAGKFFKKLTDNIPKSPESTSPSTGKAPISSQLPLSPISEGILEALGMHDGERLPDTFKDPRSTIDEFRQRLFAKPPYTLKELLVLYQQDCQNRNIKPLHKVLDHLMSSTEGGKQLTTLNLSHSQMDMAQTKSMSNLFILAHNLRRVSLENTNMNDEMLLIVLRALLLADKLPWLSLAYSSGIRSNGLKLMALHLRKSHSLRYLDLSGITMDIAPASALSKSISSGLCSLHGLKVENCNLNGPALEEFANELINSPLRALSLRGNRIRADSSALIASIIVNNPSLTKIDLGVNEIGSGGIDIILAALQNPGSVIRELYFADNYLGGVACVKLGDFLKTNKTLEFLDLSLNKQLLSEINDAVYFKDGLVQNRALKTLIMESVGFKAETVITIAEGLAENRTLQQVSFLHNDAALNPLRANIVNIGQNILSYGQKALKAINGTVINIQQMQKHKKEDASDDSKVKISPTTPFLSAGIPTAVELAMSALIALVASLRHNHRITTIEIIPIELIQDSQKNRESSPVVAQVLSLIDELEAICKRNTPAILGTSVTTEEFVFNTDKSEKRSSLSVSQVRGDLRSSQETMVLLKEMLNQKQRQKQKSSSVEAETMEQLHQRCISNRDRLAAYLEQEIVAKDEMLTDEVVKMCSTLSSVIKIYERVQRGEAVTAEELLPIYTEAPKFSAAGGSKSPQPFTLDDDEDDDE